MPARTLSAETDPCWETNGKWTPVPAPNGSRRPLLMHVLNGVHEDFRSEGVVRYERFHIVLRHPGDVSAYVHDRIEIDPFDWWWSELGDGWIAISVRFSALDRWKIKDRS